jgi:hypothetical protein
MQHGVNVFPVGSRVRVVSYGPFQELRGTIRNVHTLSPDLEEEPLCLYLVALEGTQSKEPVWFEHGEVELISAPLVVLPAHE